MVEKTNQKSRTIYVRVIRQGSNRVIIEILIVFLQMPPFNPAARALARLVTNRNPLRQLARDFPSYNQIQRSSSIVRNNAFSSVEVGRYKNCNFADCGNSSRIISNIVLQKRGFLGCGDGEEGNMLSKVHEERRVLGQLFINLAICCFSFSLILCRNPV